MEGETESTKQLTEELEKLRRRLSVLEESESRNGTIKAELLHSSENYRSILEASPN